MAGALLCALLKYKYWALISWTIGTGVWVTERADRQAKTRAAVVSRADLGQERNRKLARIGNNLN